MVSGLFAQQTPAAKQTTRILYLNAKIHVGDGTVIENGALGFSEGKITMIGDATRIRIDRTAFDEIVDAKGQHMYPGFIATDTQLGLVEVDAVRATRDDRETGYLNPSVRSIIAYSTDSKVTPTVRSMGVLMAQISPVGGRISGQSSIVQFDAWHYEDALIKADDGIYLNFPNYFTRSGWWAEPGPVKANKNYADHIKQLRDYLAEGKAYSELSNPTQKNQKFEAMRGLYDKSKRLYIRTDYARCILEAIDIAQDFDLNICIVGGADSWRVTDDLKAANVPVILNSTQRLPDRDDEDTDLCFKLPKLLYDAGVQFSFGHDGAWEQRNLIFQAGQAISYGLPYEQAVKGLTMNTADILGIGDQAGSLAKGKDATFFVSEGDVFDPRTSELSAAYIQGRKIDLSNKQKALYEKFKAKYDAEK